MRTIIILAFGLFFACAVQAQVGSSISADGTAPNDNAMLDVQSPATGAGKGMLIPRITLAQRTTSSAILDGGLLDNSGNLRGGAAQGLIVYQTDSVQGLYFNTSQTAAPAWVHLGEGADLDMQGNVITNATYYGDGRGITNLSAGAFTETDPLWASASNAIVADIATRLASNVWAAADSTTNYLAQTGGTMSGALNMGEQIITNVAHIDFNGNDVSVGRGANGSEYGAAVGRAAVGTNYGMAMGYQANGCNDGVAVGYQANGSVTGVAVGASANGYKDGVAVGYLAKGTNYGAAVGRNANGSSSGAALGYDANGYAAGAAMGRLANGFDAGAALGYDANGFHYGVAVGALANGTNIGVAVGYLANGSDVGAAVGYEANGVSEGVAIGSQAKGINSGAAVGYNANGSDSGAAVGYMANGYTHGAAIGREANARSSGAVVGESANGYSSGAVVGKSANGYYRGAAVGYGANGSDYGVAVGYYANGTNNGAAMGNEANGSVTGVAVGASANGSTAGAAVGFAANGSDYGAAVGRDANGSTEGAAVGHWAYGDNYGTAMGYASDGYFSGVAVGRQANGMNTNVAIGAYATAGGGTERIAIGLNVANDMDYTARIRGTLCLDGAASETIYWRSTFGYGDWNAKAFTIDHPLDPANKVLRHFCLEGPQVWNVYAGNAQLVNGQAVVELPEYYSALNLVGSEIYSLTPISQYVNANAVVKQKVSGNFFVVAGNIDMEVSWTIKVLRNDPGCLEDLQRRPVEQFKSELK